MKYIDHNSSRNPSKKPEMIPTLKKVSKKKDPVTCLLEKKKKSQESLECGCSREFHSQSIHTIDVPVTYIKNKRSIGIIHTMNATYIN